MSEPSPPAAFGTSAKLTGRVSPRWSVEAPKFFPLSRAGLLTARACVCVGPPLLASGAGAVAGVGDADLIVIRAVGEPAAAARADEVVGAGGVRGAVDVVLVRGARAEVVVGDDGAAQQQRAGKYLDAAVVAGAVVGDGHAGQGAATADTTADVYAAGVGGGVAADGAVRQVERAAGAEDAAALAGGSVVADGALCQVEGAGGDDAPA